jgi:nicotinate dehydrogenase subunit A
MSTLDISVNATVHHVTATPDTPLLYVLRDELGLNGPKFGCGLGQCGACTVHLGRTAVRSCITPVSTVGAQPVTTIEGLGTPERPHRVQQAFIDEQAAQCGFCINGMVMTAAALLMATPSPAERDVREALKGNLCRCGTHMRILRAVRRAAATA